MSDRPMKVALIHHIGGGNLGEDASIAAIREYISARWPHSEIACFRMLRDDFAGDLSWPMSHRALDGRVSVSSNWQRAKKKLKSLVRRQPRFLTSLQMLYRLAKKPVAAVRELTFLISSFRALRSFNVLVLSAGDQFGESTGQHRNLRPSWKYPSHIFKWVLLARIARVPSVLLNVGGAPQQGLTRAFIAGALSLADSVGFRDEQSRKSFSLRDVKRRSFVLSDPAYGRKVATPASEQSRRTRPVVGIAPMLMRNPKAPLESAFLHRMAAFAVWLINNGYFVRSFCTNINVDSASVCHMQDILKGHHLDSAALANIDRVHQWSAEELLTNMLSLDYVVTSRFHGVVFAHLLNKPVLAISDHQCVRNLMDDLGLSPYCLSIVDSSSDDLHNAFLSMVDVGTAIKGVMATKLTAMKEELGGQLDALFPSDGRSFDAVEQRKETLYAQ
jgi:polysaccharide pyruvyl transferase WcaK-like protein